MSSSAGSSVSGWVTDGGLETDLLFQRGIDLPEFASFPLVRDAAGTEVLISYYHDYAGIAAAAGAGLVLEAPTWRANRDWGRQLGFDASELAAVNREAVALMRRIAQDVDVPAVRISGVVGPQGDGYLAAGRSTDAAADYHAAQITVFADEGVDFVHAMTMNEPAEAIGVVRAARQAGVAVAVSFTVETDGRLPDGTPLSDAVAQVDEVAAPDWYGINCAHPTHIRNALDGGAWQSRFQTYRPNASTLTHAELDVMEELDTGDRDLLVRATRELRELVPSLTTVGGCCGTDATHVAALWGVAPPAGAG
jgi:S-methylmethionine-dependent homocysteine/selenocysteine methylase